MSLVFARVALSGLVMVIVVALLYDPYTTAMTPDAPFLSPPLWRIGVIATECLLLCSYVYLLWKRRSLPALLTLAIATLIDLILNIALVLTAGMDRFLVAYGTAEILSSYLAFLALRVVVLTATAGLVGFESHSSRKFDAGMSG